MKYRIIKKMSSISAKMIFMVQKKSIFWPFWYNMQYGGMCMTSYPPEFDSIGEAQKAIIRSKHRKNSKIEIIEEN